MNFKMMSLVVAAFLTACGGGDSGGSQVLVDETKTLGEGQAVVYTLEAGSYSAEVASNSHGVIVQWTGAPDCLGSTELRVYSKTCNLNQKGLVSISNPTTFGLGASEITSIKITKN